MRNYIYTLLLTLLCANTLPAQNREKRLDIGLSWGYGGVHTLFIPSVDLRFHSLTLRGAWTPATFSLALNQEIVTLIHEAPTRLDLVVALGYYRTNDKWYLDGKFTNYTLPALDGGKAHVGLRFEAGPRLCIRALFGVARNHRRLTGNFQDTQQGSWRTWPNAEVSVGLRLFSFPNHPKP